MAESDGLTLYTIASDLVKIAVPALLVAVGWLVASSQHDKRERRKEIKDLIDQVNKLIDDLRVDVRAYYSVENTEHVGKLSNDIKLKLLLISQYLITIKTAGLTMSVQDQLIALRKTATGGFFESPNFRNQAEDPQWSSRLDGEVAELKFKLYKIYFNRFAVKMNTDK